MEFPACDLEDRRPGDRIIPEKEGREERKARIERREERTQRIGYARLG